VKKQRGIVETRFATIGNAGLTRTNYRTEDTGFKYGVLLELRQNINNLLRLEVKYLAISELFLRIVRQIPKNHNI